MATEILRPSDDGDTLEWAPSAAVDHYSLIDDVATDPTDPGTATSIAGDGGDSDEIKFAAGALTSITQVVVHIYAQSNLNGPTVDISFDGGNTYTGSPEQYAAGGEGWYSVTFSGLNETNSENIECDFVENPVGSATIYCAYIVVTGDEAAPEASGNMGMKKYW